MVKRTQLVRLRDMLEAIDGVADMISDTDLAGYRRDFKLRKSGGPASSALPPFVARPSVPPGVPPLPPAPVWNAVAEVGSLKITVPAVTEFRPTVLLSKMPSPTSPPVPSFPPPRSAPAARNRKAGAGSRPCPVAASESRR